VLGGLAVGAGAIVIGVGAAIVLPIYGAYRLHLKLQQQKRAKRERKAREEMWKKLEDMQNRGEFLNRLLFQSLCYNFLQIFHFIQSITASVAYFVKFSNGRK